MKKQPEDNNMPVIDFPFGKEKLSLDIPSHRLTGVLESSLHAYTPAASEEALVRAAMEKPIGSPRLMELARGKNKIVIPRKRPHTSRSL